MQIVWGEGARQDLMGALAFIAEQSPAGARRVADRIFAAVELLGTFPELAPASTHRSLRQLTVPRTPYVVIYRVHADQIEIRAVIHAKRSRRK